MITTTELARLLGVSTSTVTNWTRRADGPLTCSGTGRARRIGLKDYEDFARSHSTLRGVARHVLSTNSTSSRSELKSAVRSLEHTLQQVELVIEGTMHTGQVSKELQRQISQVLRDLKTIE